MNITFIKDCPPVAQTGWSAYKTGDKATLNHGAHLVAVGVAREGWEVETPAPAPKKTTRKRTRKAKPKTGK